MGEKNWVFFTGILLIIFLIGVVSPSFEIGSTSHSIETTYSLGEKISGWISIKLTNESNFSVFEDSEGNSMSLISLIEVNPAFQYSVDSSGNLSTENFQNLYLDNGTFELENTGLISYQLNFSNTEIFTEEINVSDENLNNTINEKLNELSDLKSQIASYDEFYQSVLNSSLNIDSIGEELANLSEEYENAETQEEIDAISEALLLIEIPKTIDISRTASAIILFVESTKIDLETLLEFLDEEESETEGYKTAIAGWNFNNLNIKTDYNEFSGIYNISPERIAGIFDLEISKKTSIDYPFYLFIEKMDNINFKENYSKQEQGDYYIFELNENEETISFSTTEDIDFESLSFFISPSLTKLSVQDFDYEEGGINEKEKFENKKWLIFGLMILLVLIFGLIIYLVLQTWYKRRYEDYLFRNKNDLYNLASYISNSKKRGLDNSQIAEKLKKSRWNSEQIRYALRKYTGKSTGMYEIPLNKILKNKNKGAKNIGRFPK